MKIKIPVLLACLALALTAQAALAQMPAAAGGCQMTVESIVFAVQPVSHDLPAPSPPGLEDSLTPEPIFKAVIGDCCPGNQVANCPDVPGYFKRCDKPQCETGEYSCLYWR